MRLQLCFLIGLLGLLGGCDTARDVSVPTPLPQASDAQKQLYERAIAQFRVGGKEFESVLREGKGDPVLAKALTMFLAFHMRDAEQRQRLRQGGSLEVRSLEDNVRYVQARAGLKILGASALPTVRTELIENRHTENRLFGVATLIALGPDQVAPIQALMAASEERYRRYYAEAVSQMPPSSAVEKQLLRWVKNEDFSVRSEALVGLTRYGDRHLALLRSVVASDPDQFVQRQVVANLGRYKDLATVSVVIAYYDRCVTRRDDRGSREAERTLLRMSGMQAKHSGQRMKVYGLAYWQKWAASLPKEGR